MLCPYCQNEMTDGFIQSRDGVFWTPERAMIPSLAFLKRSAVPLGSEPGMTFSAARACLCRACNKVIIDINRDL